jgi:hypothetical protein
MDETTGTPEQIFGFERDAGRLELLVRIGYWIVMWAILVVYGFIAALCLIVQWFHILILARRHQGLSEFVRGYLEYQVYISPYAYFMTDTRPELWPKNRKVFVESG